MTNAMKWLIGIPVGITVLLGGCCVFGAIVSPSSTSTPAASETAPDAGPALDAQRTAAALAQQSVALDSINSAVETATAAVADEKVAEARAALDSVKATTVTYQALPLRSSAMANALAQWADLDHRVAAIEQVHEQVSLIRGLMDQANRSSRSDPVAAETGYTAALEAMAQIDLVPEAICRRERCPNRENIEAKIRGVAPAAARARQEAAELAARCGEHPPTLSAWDGELVGSESFLRSHYEMYDEDALDVENCRVNGLTERDCWNVDCMVRGKNAFGMNVVNRYRFTFGAHGILSSRPL